MKNNIVSSKKKKLIIILGVCGILGFAGAFITTKFSNDKKIEDASAFEQSNRGKSELTANNNKSNKDKNPSKDEVKDKVTNVIEEVDPEKVIDGKNYSKVGQPFVDSAKVVKDYLYGSKTPDKKVAYLTFDDGPSRTNTPEILDILKENDVKGTFFVVGYQLESEEDNEIVRRIIKEGHAIGNHTYSHDYKKLYSGGTVNTDAFMEDIDKCDLKLREVLGDGYKTSIIRMPGGHMSWKKTENLDKELKNRNITSIDWNCINGDGEYKKRTEKEMFDYFKETAGGHSALVILMHDLQGKEKTKNILPKIISYLKKQGYEFRTIG